MDLAEELRERTALRYAGDCKCGKCQLVPRTLVDDAANEIDRLRGVLRCFAEGNLGDAKWQADYAKIKAVAAASLNPS